MTTAVYDLELELQEARRRVRQLEERLAEQRVATESREAMLATVVDHVPIVLWSLDAEGIITLCEGRGKSPADVLPSDMVGRSAQEVFGDNPQLLEILRRALGGEGGTYLNQVGDLWFESWVSPVVSEDGLVTGVIGVSTDVTSSKRSEQAERSLRERFEHVFHSSPIGSVITEFETGTFLDANPAFCKLLGYRRDELVGHSSLELGFWRNQSTRRSVLGEAMQPNQVLRAEHRLQTKSGKWRTIRFASRPIEIEGRPCLLTVLHDATQQKRWETALRRSYLRYRQLARFAPVGIFRATNTAGWTFANAQLGRIWSRERHTLKGTGWLDAVHSEDRDRVLAAFRRGCETGIPVSVEFRVQPHSDVLRWVLLRMEPHVDQGTYLGTAIDITQRIQTAQDLERLNAELESRIDQRTTLLLRANQMLQEQIYERRRAIELLEESQERWRSLVQNAPDMIMQINPDRTIAFINHTGVRPRYTPQAVIGCSISNFLPPSETARVERELDRVLIDGESISHEISIPNGRGDVRSYQSHIAPIVRNGRVTGATVVCRDVTQFKQAAEQLRHTQDKLVHVARVTSVGEMTAALAHELNQPLAAIANYVRGCMIRLTADSTASPEILQTLQASVDEAHRASEVIRRLRQFLQRQELQREAACLNDLVQDALKLAEAALRRVGAQTRVTLSDGLPSVTVDRVQIIQVVLNLLINAVESMEGLSPGLREVVVETSSGGEGLLSISIADSGPGLPAHLGEAIFDPFVTTKRGGLGMGLSICRTIVEAHQGALRCESPPDGGARFHILLPVVELKVVG